MPITSSNPKKSLPNEFPRIWCELDITSSWFHKIGKYLLQGDESMVKGANRISWATPAPLGDCLLGVYFRTFLEYFEQFFLKNILKSLKFSLDYYVMVYIKNLLKIWHCQKIQVHLQVLLLLKSIGYNVFKMFLGIFHLLNWFQKNLIYILIHWK